MAAGMTSPSYWLKSQGEHHQLERRNISVVAIQLYEVVFRRQNEFRII